MKRVMTVEGAYQILGICREDRLYDIESSLKALEQFCERNSYTIVDGIIWSNK